MKCTFVVCLSLLLFFISAAHATIRHVRPDGTGEYATIRAAIAACLPGDVVELSDGIYTGADNRNLSFLGKAITVRSAGDDPRSCVIDCQNASTGFTFVSGETASSVLRGITVQNGEASSGGALSFSGASPRIEKCVFRNSHAAYGGALYT